ncbi:MAG: glycosyl hydrolase-related protein [Bacteroidetes bacterium]|nr:glycosyl hydrolase-related protein [Bacteroidota bacterium]
MYKFIISSLIVLSVIIFGNSYAQTAKNTSPLLKGCVKVISGEPIEYHCFNSAATSAILTRCTSGEMQIEWETEAIPVKTKEKFVTFYWICSYSSGTSKGDRNFDISINNSKYFSFQTHVNKNDKQWLKKAEDGCELSFEYKGEDGLNDISGFMYLKVPVAKFKKGEGIRIKVVGEKADSRDWYMTFLYAMNNSFNAYAMPFLANINGKTQQLVRADISYPKEKGKAIIQIAGKTLNYDLVLGLNNFEISIDPVTAEKEIGIDVSVDGEKLASQKIMVTPVKKRSIYLMSHSHNDIGYSDIQTDVLNKQIKNINDALDLIKKTKDYPAEARYKWNVEILWATESFLATASEEKKKEFIDAVKNGYMGLQAMYTNPLTGLSRPEEFYKLTEYARILSKKYNLTINSAMISDIPGMTWNTIPTLAQSGIKYFSSGPNFMNGFKTLGGDAIGSGDRVGYSSVAWGDKPFYWISPSGKEKLLYWMAGLGYSAFHRGSITRNELLFKKTLTDYFSFLDRKAFPYDMLQMRYTIKGDNGPTDPELSDFVKSWNEKYESPKIILSTSEQAFEAFEKKYGKDLPSYSGDLTPYWEDGAVSSAYETGLIRNVSENLVQSEILYSIISPEKYNAAKFYVPWRNVLLWDEHTWGAYNSTSDPDCEFAKTQWNIKQAYALDAVNQSKEIRDEILQHKSDQFIFSVINTNSWKRSDIVIIPKEKSTIGDVIKNEKGKAVPSQRLSNGDLAFLAENIPGLSGVSFTIYAGKSTFKSNLRIEKIKITDDSLSFEIDPFSACIKHLQYKNIAEMVDKNSNGLNEYLYVEGYDASKAKTATKNTISIKENGPLIASFLIKSEAPGCNSIQREIRLVKGMNKIDIINTIDKKLVRKGEAIHFAYPFTISDPEVRIDLGYAVISPEKNQLAGACKDYYSAQRFVDVSNKDYGVTLTLNETPLVEIGEMHSELPDPGSVQANASWKKTQIPSSRIFTYVMNNYWYTNYKADQAGISSYTHSIIPHLSYNQISATQHGIESSQPLILQETALTEQSRIVPPFTLSNNNVYVSSIKPAKDNNALIVRIYNPGNTTEEVNLNLSPLYKNIYRSSPFEEQGEKLDKIKMLSNEIVTVMITR